MVSGPDHDLANHVQVQVPTFVFSTQLTGVVFLQAWILDVCLDVYCVYLSLFTHYVLMFCSHEHMNLNKKHRDIMCWQPVAICPFVLPGRKDGHYGPRVTQSPNPTPLSLLQASGNPRNVTHLLQCGGQATFLCQALWGLRSNNSHQCHQLRQPTMTKTKYRMNQRMRMRGMTT